ncbi:MAG: 4'-phosphopantetheinyl transferase superfamily protein [Atopobiaceae bacterium]|nr:4'-phosphopantetheinyl transferase superfamily protein [Atopobiaceae bacterium]
MDVICWSYDVEELEDDELFRAGMEALPWEERKGKVERLRFGKDRRLSLGAGLLCAWTLGRAGVTDLELALGPHGKPKLAREANVHFNLSHSGTIALCAVSDESVGADVQELHANDAGIARICYTAAEQRWIAAQDDTDWAFTRLWARKESYLKLLGTGLSKDALSFEAMPGASPEEGVEFCESERPGHAICVCTRAGGPVEFADAPSRFWMA